MEKAARKAKAAASAAPKAMPEGEVGKAKAAKKAKAKAPTASAAPKCLSRIVPWVCTVLRRIAMVHACVRICVCVSNGDS